MMTNKNSEIIIYFSTECLIKIDAHKRLVGNIEGLR